MANRWGKSGSSDRCYFLYFSKIPVDSDCSHEIKRHLLLRRKAMINLGSILKNRDITLPTNIHIVKAMIFPVVMYGCESWTIKKTECWRIDDFVSSVVLEKTLESLMDCKSIKPVNLKGNQPWILIGRTYAEAEAPVFWSSDVNSWETGNVPDAGKDWRKKEKRASEVEIAGWHHWCNGCEFGQTLGDEEGQGGLAYRSSWDHKELDTTRRLNNDWS